MTPMDLLLHLLKTRSKIYRSCWFKKFPLPKPSFMSVPNFGAFEGKKKSFLMKLDIKVTFGCTFMVVNIVTVGSCYGWPRRNQTIWSISLFLFNSSCLWWDWQKTDIYLSLFIIYQGFTLFIFCRLLCTYCLVGKFY